MNDLQHVSTSAQSTPISLSDLAKAFDELARSLECGSITSALRVHIETLRTAAHFHLGSQPHVGADLPLKHVLLSAAAVLNRAMIGETVQPSKLVAIASNLRKGVEQSGASDSRERTYTPAEAADLAGISDATLSRYAKRAGIATPGPGKRNHRYGVDEVRSILALIVAQTSDGAMRERCRTAIDSL